MGLGVSTDDLEIDSDDPDEDPLLVALAGEAEQQVLNPVEIPTLSEWALVLLAVGLGFMGWGVLCLRKRRTADKLVGRWHGR